MDRREFFAGTSLGALGLALSDAVAQTPSSSSASGQFGFNVRADSKRVAAAYLTGLKGGLGPPPIPYVFAYYDEDKKRFLTPLEVSPVLDASKTYSLSPELHSFNISASDQALHFSNLKNQVQLNLNATVPSIDGDVSWVFLNAVDVFAGKSGPNASALTSFLNSGGPNGGAQLQAKPQVKVQNGVVNLQFHVFGQKQDGFWTKFIHSIAGFLGNSTVSTALTGFGVPSLTKDALQFVSHTLDTLTQNEKLVTLWQYGGLNFGVASNTKERFRMRSGLWILVDYNYAKETMKKNSILLEGHSIDTNLQTFKLLDGSGKPADANWLTADMHLDPV